MMSLLNKVKKSPAFVSAQRQYDALPSRDQKALLALSVALGLAILFFLVWSPAHTFAKQEKANLESAQELLSWVKANEMLARTLVSDESKGSSKIQDSQSLVSTVSSNAQKHKIKLKRFEPSGERKVRVWIEKAPFDNIIVWLKDLNTAYDISVSQISIDRDEKGGLVNVRITLKS